MSPLEQTSFRQEGTTMFIRDVIRDRKPYSLQESVSVLEAAEFMAQRRIGAVCVLDEEGS
jgi:CBS domain-containing protein